MWKMGGAGGLLNTWAYEGWGTLESASHDWVCFMFEGVFPSSI